MSAKPINPSKVPAPRTSVQRLWDSRFASEHELGKVYDLLPTLVAHGYDPEDWFTSVIGCDITALPNVSGWAADHIAHALSRAASGADLMPVGDL
jgi:hypothetical protein